MTVLALTWAQFDNAVAVIAAAAPPASGVFGLPRGGLPLAVALSHRLRLPLRATPHPGCLIVDDIVETGRALAPYRGLGPLAAWVGKIDLPGVITALTAPADAWVLFPWEDPAQAEVERTEYAARQ